MYKYQCSKETCGNTWTLKEGFINGFTLTCPYCGKGRGLFIEQLKKIDSMNLQIKNSDIPLKI